VDIQGAIRANLKVVRTRVARAAARVGRDPAGVRLIAISKTFGMDYVRAAAAAGLSDFGENRVQEALQKIEAGADMALTWHLVGHLQSNKARRAAASFGVIHSVDSLDLLHHLERAAAEVGRRPRVLVQVDLAGEATKFGAPPSEAAAIVRDAATCQALRLAGLMVLPPFIEDPDGVRPYFARLRTLRDAWVESGVPAAMLGELSMGMSHDFEVAIEEGATMVRVGTAIFGARTGP